MRGTVKWFNSQKGYGFIKSEDGKEVFVHYSNVNKKGYRVLYQDEIVDFEIGTNSDGCTVVK